MQYGARPWVSLAIWSSIAAAVALGLYLGTSGNVGDAVLLGTAVFVAWYSLETNLLRRATETTIEVDQTPFLTLNLHEGHGEMYLTIENIGKAIARHIRFVPFRAGELNFIFNLEGANDFLYPAEPGEGRVGRIKPIARRDDRGTLGESQYRALYKGVNDDGPAFIIAHYRNPVGRQYHSVYRLSARLRGSFSPLFEFVTAGKGEIDLAMAQEQARLLEQTHPSVVLDTYITKQNPKAPH